MTSNLLGIGLTGLNAAQTNLLTTGHNIANAATPGYTRQQAMQVSVQPQLTGAGFIGNGVRVDTVRRLYSEFLSSQVVSTQARSSDLESHLAQLRQIDSMLADPASGLSPALQSFFNAVQDVATHPENLASRQAMLSGASALISRFELIGSSIHPVIPPD